MTRHGGLEVVRSCRLAGNSAAKRAKSTAWLACRQEFTVHRIAEVVRDMRS